MKSAGVILIMWIFMVMVMVCASSVRKLIRDKRSVLLLEVERRGGTFERKILDATNNYRAKHGVSALTWDSALENTATKWAQKLATEEKFYHSNAPGLGENLYYAMGWPIDQIPELAVQSWYDEVKDYNFGNPTFGHNTGHFTQLVWKSTTKMGCGMSTSKSGKMYVCCNYSPAGNWMGEFGKNVFPPQA